MSHQAGKGGRRPPRLRLSVTECLEDGRYEWRLICPKGRTRCVSASSFFHKGAAIRDANQFLHELEGNLPCWTKDPK